MTHLYTQRSVGELRPGDHAWLAFAHPDEQSRVLGDFVYAGLDAGEKVICVTDSSPRHLPGLLPRYGIDATPFAEAGHLAVVPWHVACARDGFSDPALLASTLEREIAKALDQKFHRVRITADMTWAAGLPGGDQFMLACDNEVEAMIGPSTLATGICQVDRSACTPEAIDVLQHHHEVLVEVNPEYDDGVLRITRTYRPHGLKLEGEIDGARHAAFTQTLTQVSDPRSEVHLDLDKLKFIDLGALSLIGTHALRLTRGNGLVLDNPTPELQGVIDMVGFHRYPGITRGEGWRAQ